MFLFGKNRNRRIRFAYFCHKGLVRKINQDNFLVNESNLKADEKDFQKIKKGICSAENALFAVFDGMGGEQCGEMASLIASDSFKKLTKQKKDEPLDKSNEVWIRECIASTGRDINAYMDENGILSMGTTMASIFTDSSEVLMANIGDSRVYRVSDETLEQISKDHVAIAPEGRKAPLYQFLGIRDGYELEPHIVKEPFLKGARYLLCSDGLTDCVAEIEIEKVINENSVEKACRMLSDAALENGGRDNITVILIELL